MMRYPKRIPAGTVRDEMILDTDLAPTFLDLAGVPIPAHIQGVVILRDGAMISDRYEV